MRCFFEAMRPLPNESRECTNNRVARLAERRRSLLMIYAMGACRWEREAQWPRQILIAAANMALPGHGKDHRNGDAKHALDEAERDKSKPVVNNRQ